MILVLALACLVALLFLLLRHFGNGDNGAPAELRDARIAAAERTYRAHSLRLVARIDRAYALPGRLHLVELKTRRRHQVYATDRLELSVQRIAIEEETGERVDQVAHVVTEVGMERRWHLVELLSREQVKSLKLRRAAILQGRVEPAMPTTTSPCGKCAYSKECGRGTP